ncbi:prefoldin subunit 3-like [Patiria miniata]|uniref:Prefoldin subunit 3 n=1 Tax=Patiria miniata TaxID=46514 RepID=A0A914BP82_PATMI|nr:prefoldin subunit 3-like [Patiria miniata]
MMALVEEGTKSAKKMKSKSHTGIPEAVFLEDVDAFMQKPENADPTAVVQRLDEQHNKYKFMELNLLQKKKRLRAQIPDIKTTLEIVQHMRSKQGSGEEMDTQFLLADQVYAKASIPPSDRVCLWLGANVMLEYSLEDAESLLTNNLTAAKESLLQVDHDLDFLRDQYTTTEVNMARVYNYGVKKRQGAQSAS